MPKIDPGLAQRQRRSKVAIPALCMILIAISQVSADPVSNPKAGGRPGDLGPYKDPVEAYSTEDGPLRKVSLKQLGEILPGLYGGGPAAPYVYYMDVDNMLSSPDLHERWGNGGESGYRFKRAMLGRGEASFRHAFDPLGGGDQHHPHPTTRRDQRSKLIRLSLTDNINVLRDNLYAELARRNQENFQKMLREATNDLASMG